SANCPLCKHITDDIQIGKCEGCNQIVYDMAEEIKVKMRDNKVKVCFLTASEYTEYEEFLKEDHKVTVKCFARKPLPIGDLAKIVKEQLKEG
nr:hypothetical protein [Thermoproteota archaeon]